MSALIACPVCFGASDAPMAVATNMGILMMLGVVAVMLASFAVFFIYLNRRARMVADGPARSGTFAPNTFATTDPQEGTA